MHQATLDLQKAMQKMKKSYREYYILKMDVRKFFNSIDKKILYKILKKRIKDEKLLWLIRQILSAQERQKGIEIGNYTSQTFANIYLNELDQYATRKLKIKNYYRYMDDIVILARNKNEAKEYLNEIKEFLQKKLELELNDKTNIFKAKQGVNFCGYKINEYRLKVRNKGKNKFKKKVKNLLKEKILKINKKEVIETLKIDQYTLDDIIDCLIKPNRSIRDQYQTPLLKKDILHIEDLKPGMVLEGTVRNVVDFGAFIDIGLKNDGLVHISKMSKQRIKHPLDVLSIGDIVEVNVIDVDLKKNRVSLSMI